MSGKISEPKECRNEKTVFLFVQMMLVSVQDVASVNGHHAPYDLSKVSILGDPCDSAGD
jgi:hypothetical protein